MTNAPKDFDLAQELADTAAWDEETDQTTDVTSGETPDQTGGQLDLAERHALRRVAGLSTELEDISEVEYRQLRLERVILVGVWTDGSVEAAENAMPEPALLAETAGSEVLDALYQRRDSPDPATYIGRGKVEGLGEVGRGTRRGDQVTRGEARH